MQAEAQKANREEFSSILNFQSTAPWSHAAHERTHVQAETQETSCELRSWKLSSACIVLTPHSLPLFFTLHARDTSHLSRLHELITRAAAVSAAVEPASLEQGTSSVKSVKALFVEPAAPLGLAPVTSPI